ncbi:TIGR00341 family protein [Mucilaginibacter sp. UYCu711]|uniref:TIGR00341 family protein n=1 Tax=Mucilaginibacter sp. UYCu711 TaxID=3156339 RepID=UPI003D1B472C
MGKLITDIRTLLTDRFHLQDGKAEESVIIDAVKNNIDFKGANLFALIFAIFIASIGLNVNSTAVIIGAMLISPIMGPVMGIGLGIGINDLDLVRRGLKNLFVATVIAVIASTIYFLITPLHNAQSELLARTSPSIWDVFIAFFGGLAGMVAASRKEKTNVIPGVAIATALIPPLCTAGFGIAMGNWYFVLGALYLYFINSVFIAIATFLMARYLKMKKHHLEDIGQEKKVNRYIILIVIITIVPSIFMAYRIVDKSIFENNARKFVEKEFIFLNTQVVSKSIIYKNKTIDLLLLGSILDKPVLDSIRKKLPYYKLTNVTLVVRQGLNARQQIDLSQIKASIIEDVFKGRADTIKKSTVNKPVVADSTVLAELKILYPSITSFGVNQTFVRHTAKQPIDTVSVALATFNNKLSDRETSKLAGWIKLRYQMPKLVVVTNFYK